MFIRAQNPLFNGSTTPLGISGVFTGVARDASGGNQGGISIYSNFNVHFISDQASATNGVIIQGSQDAAFTTPRLVAQASLVANTPLLMTVPIIFPFYRTVLTNGAAAQTSLSATSSFTL